MRSSRPILLVEDDDVDAMTTQRALKELKVVNKLGTGVIYQIQVTCPGLKTPQTYMLNQTSALEGTEVGSGKVLNLGIAVNIPIPNNVAEVSFVVRATVASQTYYIGVKWTGP